MLYKLVNGQLVKGTVVRHTMDGKDFVTTNPTNDFLLGLGYKPLECPERPTVSENERLVPVYTEQADRIVCSWEVQEVSNDPEE